MDEQTVSLRDYMDQRFDSSDKAINAALAAAKEAVLKAEAASEKRFEAVNEFRASLSDQQRTLMPRVESELVVKNLADRLKVLEDAKTQAAGGWSGARNLWGVIVGVIGVLSIIASYFLSQ